MLPAAHSRPTPPAPAQPGRVPQGRGPGVHGGGEGEAPEQVRPRRQGAAPQPGHPPEGGAQHHQAPEHHRQHGEGVGKGKHGRHGEGQGPQPQGEGPQQPEQEGLNGRPVPRLHGDEQPAQRGVGQQGEKGRQQPRPGGGDQLAQVDAHAGDAAGHLVFQGVVLVLLGKDRVGRHHGQVEPRGEEGDQQGHAVPEGALEHPLPSRPAEGQGQEGGQRRQDGQGDPKLGPGRGAAPLGGQIAPHAAAPYLISFLRKASRPTATAPASHASPTAQHRPT